MAQPKTEWQVITDVLRETSPALLDRIGRRMMNHLFKRRVRRIESVMARLGESTTDLVAGSNQPAPRIDPSFLAQVVNEVFQIAAEELPAEEITRALRLWLRQEQARFLSLAAERRDIPLSEICEALHRFSLLPASSRALSQEEGLGIRAALIRRIFSEDPTYIDITKRFTSVTDFSAVLERTVGPARGNGKLGGKAAGLFRAERILSAAKKDHIALRNLAVPRSWFITSDGILDFLHFNAMEEMYTIKYRDPGEIRGEYAYLEQLFKNSPLPPEIMAGLNLVLDGMGERPLIVRSSSLLEDSLDSAFAGKYKSLFVVNQGSRRDRLAALADAVVEVYASVFGPDPIEYRRDRGLLDFNEEMAILIQEVVGRRVGRYYFPAFAGVAFSLNEFRWSPRIRREDGFVRLVAGLGTRAVDRVGEDYPVLVAPGLSGLRATGTPEETVYYSQRFVDLINLETGRFESVPLQDLLQEVGADYPALSQIVSLYSDGMLFEPVGTVDLDRGQPVVTFNNLLQRGPFIPQIREILQILTEAMGGPVDVEFACDGNLHQIYLLQCRPQCHDGGGERVTIPSSVPDSDRLFSARRFVTAGLVRDLEWVVYVDGAAYTAMGSYEEMMDVARLVGELNVRLPRRRFVLIGPGRWGSRGDIKLGVKVGYGDIHNAAMLVEVARRTREGVPDLSFGTHFFQDLVEAHIRYLPLYPDEEGIIFREDFFLKAPNQLRRLLPSSRLPEKVLRVIHVPSVSDGAHLAVAMDGDQDEALGYLER